MITPMSTPHSLLLGLSLLSVTGTARAFQLGPLDRERGVIMLRTIRRDLEKHYYDSTFHGLPLAPLFDSAEADIKSAPSNGDIFGIIARTLLRLNDSHTFFDPPRRAATVDYGWVMRIIGDTAYVTDVTPGSDAETQGLKVGDAVLGVDRYQPTRSDFWNLLYLYNFLSPQAAVTLLVRSPGAAGLRQLLIHSRVTPGRAVLDYGRVDGADYWDEVRERQNARHAVDDRFAAVGNDVLVWQMREFIDEDQMDRAMKRARDYPNLIIDVRNNLGGSVRALVRLTSYFVSSVDTIATTRRRNETVPMISTPASRPYGGRLFVLADAGSASAAEVFARAIQLKDRGVILGDTTSGAVMQSRIWQHTIGADIMVGYAVSITDADVVMADGGRLEVLGVVPNLTVLPTGADLAAGRDPALALAMTRAGHPTDGAAAGKLFPSP
jgi:carboxyl-terminal processing protease